MQRDELLASARKIKLAIFDVDGVMSDGRLHYCDDGSEIKSFFAQDGLGLKHLMAAGVETAIISGRHCGTTEHRMRSLGISRVHQGKSDKVATFDLLVSELELDPAEVLYCGDDLIDLPLLDRAGLGIGVPNGHPALIERVDWITPRAGGFGAVRDVCDLLLEARGALAALVEKYHPPASG